jgi:hypothetical protein
MTVATLFFVVGLVGFTFSGNSLLLWGISAAFFTIGEVIYAPGEYMLIDNIAPAGMKASYFSAQSLGWLGAAVNPLVSGVIFNHIAAVVAVCGTDGGNRACLGANDKRHARQTLGPDGGLLMMIATEPEPLCRIS